MYKRQAMDIYRTLLFEEKLYKCRMAAGYIQSLLTQAAAFMNRTFADCGIFSEKQAVQGLSLSLIHISAACKKTEICGPHAGAPL